jgi:transposase
VSHALPSHGWTLKKLCGWVESTLGRRVSRSLLRRILKAGGLSWKKCKKLLRKANPQQRATFVEEFQRLFARMCRDEICIVYVDEAHFHQDLDLGYTWAPVGKPVWRASTSPPLAARINWYGAYDFSQGRAFIWQEGKCNGEHTRQFLQRLTAWLQLAGRQLVIIWDGASWHRSHSVRTQAQQLGIELLQLPAYSPDLNPIEGLWKWMRAEVTQHFCHDSLPDLFDDCKAFIDRINLDPDAMISRLWPKFDLDPDYEKLLLST